jgi:hypothetical protein
MNSPYLKPAQWDTEVNTMIKVMGAPIDDAGVIFKRYDNDVRWRSEPLAAR